MIKFAVQTPEDAPDKARWVLAVDPVGERFLVVGEDKSFQWVSIADCKFIQMIDPAKPQPVVPMTPKGPHLIKGSLGQLPRSGDGS